MKTLEKKFVSINPKVVNFSVDICDVWYTNQNNHQIFKYVFKAKKFSQETILNLNYVSIDKIRC